MRRREIVAWLIAASVPAGAWAQKQPRISILHSGFPYRTAIHELIGELGKHGYENGRTATIDVLGGEGNAERLAALVAQLAAQKPDVIIALTNPAHSRPATGLPPRNALALSCPALMISALLTVAFRSTD